MLAGVAPTHADQATDTRSRLERLRTELGQALGALRERLQTRDSLRARLAEADRQVAEITSRLRADEAAAAALEAQLAALRAEQTQARARLEAQRQALARSLALAARGGQGDRLKLLLTQQDPTRLARLLRYQRYVADAQAAHLAELRRQLDAFSERETRIAAEAERLAGQRRQLDQERQRLADVRQQRLALLAQADLDVARGEQRVRAIEQDQRELAALLTRLAERAAAERAREQAAREDSARAEPQQSASNAPPESDRVPQQAPAEVSATPTPSLPGERFSARRSRLPWPVSGPLKARFGSPRESGRTRWDGVVIAARPGSTVRSIHAGKVVYADVLGGYGLLVIVDHGEGYLSLYGYNDAVLKRVGQRVQAGEPIASVGDRGSASGVYFEIRYRGQPVNPSAWCGG
jgi:septal ring factor EnvC (AmiA/AmiB activator)